MPLSDSLPHLCQAVSTVDSPSLPKPQSMKYRCCLAMASTSKNNEHDYELFHDVFTEGPFEELITRCDVITAASLIGLSKLFLESAKASSTLDASMPFGLACVLHSPMKKGPLYFFYYFKIDSLPCKLSLLDSFSSDAMVPGYTFGKWVGANGYWISIVGFRGKSELCNVYTHRKIPLPALSFQATDKPTTLLFDNDLPVVMQKIAIRHVPTAIGRSKDFSLVAVFNVRISILNSGDDGWIVLPLPLNHTMSPYCYNDGITHDGLVFATTLYGNIHVWDPLHPGPALVLARPAAADELVDSFLNATGDEHDYFLGFWWLARSADGSQLLHMYTLGASYDPNCLTCHWRHRIGAAHPRVVHCGRTISTYTFGFGCLVFSLNTGQVDQANLWERIADLGSYSLFLGVNYPIIMRVGSAHHTSGYLTRRNYVYILPTVAWLSKEWQPELCRFSMSGKYCGITSEVNVLEGISNP